MAREGTGPTRAPPPRGVGGDAIHRRSECGELGGTAISANTLGVLAVCKGSIPTTPDATAPKTFPSQHNSVTQ
jgi:hypothetical protein